MDKQTRISTARGIPAFRKRSRAKLWIRAGIVAVFGVVFGVTLARDLSAGVFEGLWAGALFLLGLLIGYRLRLLVPMQTHPASQHVTLSFDRVYFALIVALVLAKAIAGNLLGAFVIADAVMCLILGLMLGRLSGICLRVFGLKKGMRAAALEQTG